MDTPTWRTGVPDQAWPAVVVDGDDVFLIGGKEATGTPSTAFWRGHRPEASWERTELPLGLRRPRAWLRGDRIVAVGSTDRYDAALRLDRDGAAEVLHRTFVWPPARALEVDAAGNLFGVTTGAPSFVPREAVLPVPDGAAPQDDLVRFELPDGAWLGWRESAEGETVVYRLDGAGWSPIGTVDGGEGGLTAAAAVVPGGVAFVTMSGDLLRLELSTGMVHLVAPIDGSDSWEGGMLAALPGRVVAVLGAGAWSVDLTVGTVTSHTGPQRPRIRGTAIPAADGVLLVGGFDRRTFGVPPERLVLT